MNKYVNDFLNNIGDINTSDIRWRISNDDIDFFNECIDVLKLHNIKTVLDISCGKGQFVSLCNQNNIESYGIDPISNNSKHVFVGTYDSIINNSNLLSGYKFDCITVHNTLHGKHHDVLELEKLFNFLKHHTKYIIISNPIEYQGYFKFTKLIYEFNPSHADKSVFHKLYQIIHNG